MNKAAKIILGIALIVALSGCAKTPTVSKDIESPFFGSKTSKVQLEIYSDFQCPGCIFFHEEIGKKLESDYIKTGKIGYTFKNFPLPFHKNAPDDAAAVMCAQAQGKFFEFSDKMYALEKEKAGLRVEDAERIKIATDISLDVKQFEICVNEGHYINKVAADEAEAQKREVPGTPAIFLNGTQMKFESKDQFFAMIEAALQQ